MAASAILEATTTIAIETALINRALTFIG